MMTSGEAVKYKSSAHAFAEIVKKEGTKSLFKGAGNLLYLLVLFLFFHFMLSLLTLNLGANILRAVAGAGVLAGYDQLQIIFLGKAYSGGGG